MPTKRLLSEAQRVRLAALPEMGHRELVRHYTLSEVDLAAVSVRRGAANRLGFATQLCLLRYPGRPLKQGEVVPRDVVEFGARQVGAHADTFGEYDGGPEGTGIFEYIECFYNPRRRHSSLGQMNPVGYEEARMRGAAVA